MNWNYFFWETFLPFLWATSVFAAAMKYGKEDVEWDKIKTKKDYFSRVVLIAAFYATFALFPGILAGAGGFYYAG